VKIAMIVPYPIVPPDEGGRVRAYGLLKYLAREHEMLLLTPRPPGNAPAAAPSGMRARAVEISPPGRRYQVLDPGTLRRAWRALRDERVDAVLCEFPWPAMHAALLALRAKAPLIIDAHNVEGDRFGSAGSRMALPVALYERFALRLASAVFAVSEADRDRFARLGVPAEKLQVVPNGVDPETTHPDPAAGAAARAALGIGAETKMLLFFGQLGYAPNREAVRAIREALLPRLDRMGAAYEFVIVGKNYEELSRTYAHSRLRYTGAVESIAPYVNAADAVAVPITSGGGTRLKVLESIACGTPVVSTPAGAEGIDVDVCGGLLTLASDWDAFAEALGRVRDERPGNVPARFLDMYSWANIVSRIRWPAR
jgi:glycosyltransferase involved in cell wall biosynthesis